MTRPRWIGDARGSPSPWPDRKTFAMPYLHLLSDPGMNYTLNRPLLDGNSPARFPEISALALQIKDYASWHTVSLGLAKPRTNALLDAASYYHRGILSARRRRPLTACTIFHPTLNPFPISFLPISFFPPQQHPVSAFPSQPLLPLRTYHTASTSLHKLRPAILPPPPHYLTAPSRPTNLCPRPRRGQRGRQVSTNPIVVLRREERRGVVRSAFGASNIPPQPAPLLPGVVMPRAVVHTDSWTAYSVLSRRLQAHLTVFSSEAYRRTRSCRASTWSPRSSAVSDRHARAASPASRLLPRCIHFPLQPPASQSLDPSFIASPHAVAVPPSPFHDVRPRPHVLGEGYPFSANPARRFPHHGRRDRRRSR